MELSRIKRNCIIYRVKEFAKLLNGLLNKGLNKFRSIEDNPLNKRE